jgi:NAD(P)-dependent dehydrogenase (short-subunit alcohol dehydrogenase family)
MLLDRDAGGLEASAEAARALGRRAVAHPCDVSDPASIRAMFARLDGEFGRVDFLGNVAGDGSLGRPEDVALEDVERTWRNLVFGRFCMCQEAGRRMLARGRGSIVNIGSLASVTAMGRGHIAYSMAMGAVAQMTRELSTEWAARGVRVNAILPAQVVNPSLEARMQADPGLEGMFLRGIPAGRLGRPDDIRGLAVFLASDASSWVTGALIPMDGGNLAVNAGGTVGRKEAAP